MQKVFILKSSLLRFFCISLMSGLMLPVQSADKTKATLYALSNGLFTYHTLNSLHYRPSKTKCQLAALGCVLGYVAGDALRELAQGSVGLGFGITTHILDSYVGKVPTSTAGRSHDTVGASLFDNIGVFLGGVHAGVSCGALKRQQVRLRLVMGQAQKIQASMMIRKHTRLPIWQVPSLKMFVK